MEDSLRNHAGLIRGPMGRGLVPVEDTADLLEKAADEIALLRVMVSRLGDMADDAVAFFHQPAEFVAEWRGKIGAIRGE